MQTLEHVHQVYLNARCPEVIVNDLLKSLNDKYRLVRANPGQTLTGLRLVGQGS